MPAHRNHAETGRSDRPFAMLLDRASSPHDPPQASNDRPERGDHAAPASAQRTEAMAPTKDSAEAKGAKTSQDGKEPSNDSERTAAKSKLEAIEIADAVANAVDDTKLTLATKASTDTGTVFGDATPTQAAIRDLVPPEPQALIRSQVPFQVPAQIQPDVPAQLATQVPAQAPAEIAAKVSAEVAPGAPSEVATQRPTPGPAPDRELERATDQGPDQVPEFPLPVKVDAAAVPQQPVLPAALPGTASEAPVATPAPAPEAAVALSVAGRAAVAQGADMPAQPQNPTRRDAKTETAPARTPAFAPSQTSSQDGEPPSGDQPAVSPPGPAADGSASTDAKPIARLQKSADTGPPPHPVAEAGAAAKGPEMALQTFGLTEHASRTAVAQVTAASAAAAPAHVAAMPVPLAGLAVEIASQAHAGKQRFEIRLDPPELGRIDVRLDVDRDGNVTSRMTVERVETLDLLKRDAAQLERALQHAGLKTADNALEFSLRQQAFARDENTAQNAARLVVSEDDPTPLDTARQGYGRLLGIGGGLDIRV
jgi:flagellar hook-length control protein FliK